MSWMAIFLHGEAAAAGVAIINSIGNMGGLLGNFLLGYLKTHLAGGYAAAMPLLGSFALVAAVSLFVLHCSIVRLQEGGGGQQFMRVAQVWWCVLGEGQGGGVGIMIVLVLLRVLVLCRVCIKHVMYGT